MKLETRAEVLNMKLQSFWRLFYYYYFNQKGRKQHRVSGSLYVKSFKEKKIAIETLIPVRNVVPHIGSGFSGVLSIYELFVGP